MAVDDETQFQKQLTADFEASPDSISKSVVHCRPDRVYVTAGIF